ncbi:hypothetical protein JOF28_000271 [Leucobacter exalbidus]|uniref:Uncharacterized protein n=1 Tax=Leucobacter exalbidus TaxID=662960 RepID=A0A940PP69_9MICO|nr:hypothetical protein [Leucobacter exalbidus]
MRKLREDPDLSAFPNEKQLSQKNSESEYDNTHYLSPPGFSPMKPLR